MESVFLGGGGFYILINNFNNMFNINSGYGALIAHALPNGFTGKLFVVASSGVANRYILEQMFKPDGDGTTRLFFTIATALAKCTASAGDVIVVAPGHTETVTAAIDVNVAGVSIIGLGSGNLRPSITGNGTIDAITVTAANVTIENLQFPAPETDNQTADINVAAAGCTIRKTSHIGSQTAKNKTDIITVATGGDDLLVEDVRAYNTVVDCVSFLSLEAAVARPTLRRLTVQGTFSTAVVMDEAVATLVTLEDSILKNVKAATAVISFASNSTGVCRNLAVSGRHTTIASNIATGTGMDFFNVTATEEAAKNGMVLPAVDAE